jgi:hypothetical protein
LAASATGSHLLSETTWRSPSAAGRAWAAGRAPVLLRRDEPCDASVVRSARLDRPRRVHVMQGT